MIDDDELLAHKKFLHNNQERSNARQEPGYVYVLVLTFFRLSVSLYFIVYYLIYNILSCVIRH